MQTMTCTRCFRDTGMPPPDLSGLLKDKGGGLAAADLVTSWKCDECLNELDREAIDRGEPPPSGAWTLVEDELNDIYADIQEGGSWEQHREREAMLKRLLSQAPCP